MAACLPGRRWAFVTHCIEPGDCLPAPCTTPLPTPPTVSVQSNQLRSFRSAMERQFDDRRAQTAFLMLGWVLPEELVGQLEEVGRQGERELSATLGVMWKSREAEDKATGETSFGQKKFSAIAQGLDPFMRAAATAALSDGVRQRGGPGRGADSGGKAATATTAGGESQAPLAAADEGYALWVVMLVALLMLAIGVLIGSRGVVSTGA